MTARLLPTLLLALGAWLAVYLMAPALVTGTAQAAASSASRALPYAMHVLPGLFVASLLIALVRATR